MPSAQELSALARDFRQASERGDWETLARLDEEIRGLLSTLPVKDALSEAMTHAMTQLVEAHAQGRQQCDLALAETREKLAQMPSWESMTRAYAGVDDER